MCNPHTLFVLRVFARKSVSVILFFFLVEASMAQHRFRIPDPIEPGSKLDVLAVNDGMYLASDGFGFSHYNAERFYLDKAESFSEGIIETSKPNGYILERRRKMTFEFGISLKSSRDFEDCFVVLHLFSVNGSEYFLPFEIGDIWAETIQEVDVSAELGFELDRGFYQYYFFSEGREIPFEQTYLVAGN